MTSALYGRMTIGPCVKTDFGFVGCSRDVIAHLHERCSGRQVCTVRVPDATLDMTDPCNQDLKSYLDVSYSCVPGYYYYTSIKTFIGSIRRERSRGEKITVTITRFYWYSRC